MVVAIQALEELARNKFGLGTSDIEFYSACMNLCNDVPARIDDDIWKHVTPYIGCIIVAQKTGTEHTDGTVCIHTLLVLTLCSAPVPSSGGIVTIVDEHPGPQASHMSSLFLDAALEGSDYDTDGDSIQVEGTSGSVGGSDCTPQDAVLFTQPELSPQQSSSLKMLEGHTQVAHVVSEDVIPAQFLQHSPYDNSGDVIVPLAMSPNRWVALSTINHQACIPSHSPEEAKRRFTGLLNKLTRVNIGFICDRIIALVDECEEAVRGNVLELFSQILFDRAVDEPERTGIYISLCEAITENLCDRRFCHGIRQETSYGSTIISSFLVKCWDSAQESFSWGESIFGSRTAESATMLSVDDYYAVQQAKRRGLGLASLGVELWNSNVLSNPRIDHLRQRLDYDPKEGDVVTMCILAHTADGYVNSRFVPWTFLGRLGEVSTRLQYRIKVSPPTGLPTEFLASFVGRIFEVFACPLPQ